MPARFSSFSVTSTGPVSISAGSEPILAKCADAGAGLQAHRLAAGLGADQHGGGAIDDAGGIAGMVDIVDLLDFRMRLDADGLEAAHFARHLEGRVERGERLHVGRRTHVLVRSQGW